MKIEEILIFKTPLDSSYSNVYDGYSTKNEYYSFLLTNFETTVIYSYDIGAKRKSVNLNKKIDLQVNLNDVSVRSINDYNYCCITAENGDKYFYFIDNYKINNSVGYEATLYCTWDSWSNNYSKLWEQNSNKEFTETRHIDEYEYKSTDSNGKNYFETINYVTDEEEYPVINSIQQDLIDGYEILYARIFCRSETYVFAMHCNYEATDSRFQFYKWANEGAMHSVSPLKVVYSPVCVINKNTKKIDYDITKYRVWFKAENNKAYKTNTEYEFEFTKNQWFTLSQGNEVVYADLTFNSPYPFSVTLLPDNTKLIEYGAPDSSDRFNGDCSYYFGGYGGDETQGTQPYSWGFTGVLRFSGTTKDFDIRLNNGISGTKQEFLNRLTSKDKSLKYTYEPHLKEYPYQYPSIFFGNNKIDLIGEKGTRFVNCKLDYVNTTSPKLWIKNDNNSDYPIKPFLAKSSGQIIVQKDTLSEYMRNNAGSIASQWSSNYLSTGIESISSIMNKNYFKTATQGLQFFNRGFAITAKQIDADNRRDSVTIPSDYALDDIYFQDSVIICDNKIEDEKDKDCALNKFILYGVNLNNYSNIFENTRHNFDFVKTSNCELSRLKISNYDKNIIKNMFDNGVRKWHITGYDEAVKNFDTEYINLQESLLKDYS